MEATLCCIIFAIIYLSVAVNSDDKLYADLIGFQTPKILFRQHRPNAFNVASKGEIYAIELTVCFEHNATKAREYKEQRYRNLQSVSWSLAEFRHNKIVQSPHENYFNICRQHREK